MKFTTLIAASAALVASQSALAGSWHNNAAYEVTITNITKAQSFTPILAATHNSRAEFFEVGTPASDALAEIAEGGNIAPLQAALDDSSDVLETTSTAGLLGPGESTTFTLPINYRNTKLSFAAMLIPTNDAFVAIDSVQLGYSRSKTVFASAYDAGTEMNDELCVSIPGPICGGAGGSPEEDGEGFVHPHAGIHGAGDLTPVLYDWGNSVAKVEIRRVRQ